MIGRIALLVLLLHGFVLAQVGRVTHKDADHNKLVNVTITAIAGAAQGTGLGYAIIDVENLDTKAHSVDITHGSQPYRQTDVASHRLVTVEPGVARFFMPIAVPPNNGLFWVSIGGVRHRISMSYRHGNGAVGLFVSDRSGQAHHGARILGDVAWAGAKPNQVDVQSKDLPADWRSFTSFAAVIVDGEFGSGAGMAADVQEALRQYAYAGGTVIIASPDSLPSGPLRDLGRKAGNERLAHGLGSVLALPPLGLEPSTLSARLAQLPALTGAMWPSNKEMYPIQAIVGLGRAPVTVFVMVILLFAILVGPVNFMILKRRRKPLLALLIVPLAGFGTTAVILTYGIFHDGFGVRGAITTCTVLDQSEHTAVSVHARTLFAGIAPSEMTMEPGSLLLSYRAGRNEHGRRHDEWPDRWSFECESQRLDGGILPSRTVTPLLTVQQGAVRERLTLRKSGDALEVLADGNFSPVGQVLVCDLDGQHWAGSDGRLRRVSQMEWAREFLKLRNRARRVQVDAGAYTSKAMLPMAIPDGSKPGTFICQVSKAPWLDDHGVAVDYDYEQHFVFGRMNAQDFVR